MERLTKRLEDGQAVMDCAACGVSWHKKRKKDIPYCTALFCRNRLKERLAAYEDTGIDPDELRIIGDIKRFKYEIIFGSKADRLKELSDADNAGRLIVLPCKVGDVIRFVSEDKQGYTRYEVISFNVDQGETFIVASCKPGSARLFSVSDIGKTVFLTREEAEAALAGKGGAK